MSERKGTSFWEVGRRQDRAGYPCTRGQNISNRTVGSFIQQETELGQENTPELKMRRSLLTPEDDFNTGVEEVSV